MFRLGIIYICRRLGGRTETNLQPQPLFNRQRLPKTFSVLPSYLHQLHCQLAINYLLGCRTDGKLVTVAVASSKGTINTPTNQMPK